MRFSVAALTGACAVWLWACSSDETEDLVATDEPNGVDSGSASGATPTGSSPTSLPGDASAVGGEPPVEDVGFETVAGCPSGTPTYLGDSPHLRMVACRGEVENVDVLLVGAALTANCDTSDGNARPDAEFLGAISDRLGNVTLKLKDENPEASPTGQPYRGRVEWELKSPADVTLCDQEATGTLLLFSSFDASGVGVLGGTLQATFAAGDMLAGDPCPEATVAISFAANCQ